MAKTTKNQKPNISFIEVQGWKSSIELRSNEQKIENQKVVGKKAGKEEKEWKEKREEIWTLENKGWS